MILTPGSRIAQYEVLSTIGAGGMGEVYRARDPRLGRDVAIKVMAPHVAADPEMRRRFETEARAIAALSHSSIVAIHELAFVDDLPVAVMELLEGQTLRQHMKAGPIEWREAARIGAMIADGLAAAHARGIVHRDLKPENVFLTTDGAVKILDFGLALRRHVMPGTSSEGPTVAPTAAHVILGTFGYMAPEQVTGDPVDARTDIFALGCILYEMVSARPRFSGATPQEIVAQLLHDSGRHLTAIDALGPREFSAVVGRCTERAASARFESAADVAMALRALQSGSPLTIAAAEARRSKPKGKSLAVLPFVNSGADPSTEFLTNGITENIINSLSQISGLRVVPRSLVFRYQGPQDPSTIGAALNARLILTGRVSQQGDYLTIQAELVDTVSESQIWGDQFRPKLTELANVQQDIAWQITEALRLKLTGAQKKKLRRRATVNPEAYQEYLRGRHFFNSWSPDGFRRALQHFERAMDLDPTYAPSYSGFGDTVGCMTYYGLIPPQDGFPRAQAAARKAISLDPELADAYATLGMGELFFEWNWPAAEQNFLKSIALNPNVATVRAFHALMLATSGRHEESIAEARHGRQLDPLSPLVNMSVGWALFFAGRLKEAIDELIQVRKILLGEANHEAGSVIIVAHEALGRFEEAARLASGTTCFGIPLDGNALLRAWREGGARGYWQERLAQLQRATLPPSLGHYNMGVVLSQIGRLDDAISELEALVADRHGGPVFFGVDPTLAPLRGHPRFEALLTRIGAPRSPTVSAPHTTRR